MNDPLYFEDAFWNLVIIKSLLIFALTARHTCTLHFSEFVFLFVLMFRFIYVNGFLITGREFCCPSRISRVAKEKIVHFVNKVLPVPFFGISRFTLEVMSEILTPL